jgi:hypothetical protein
VKQKNNNISSYINFRPMSSDRVNKSYLFRLRNLYNSVTFNCATFHMGELSLLRYLQVIMSKAAGHCFVLSSVYLHGNEECSINL